MIPIGQLTLWLLLWELDIVRGSDLSRYCYNSPPFTGYKFQLEKARGISLRYTLIYCSDNKLIYKSSVDNLDESFIINDDKLSIVKHSKTILPNKFVGALLVNGQFLSPLLTDNFLSSWIEFRDSNRILHIPVLTTPKTDDKLYPLDI